MQLHPQSPVCVYAGPTTKVHNMLLLRVQEKIHHLSHGEVDEGSVHCPGFNVWDVALLNTTHPNQNYPNDAVFGVV